MYKRVKTFEEQEVEFSLVSFIAGLFVAIFSVFLLPQSFLFGRTTFYTAYADVMVRVFGFSALANTLFAAYLRFSREQFKMLTKLMLILYLLLPLSLIAVSSVTFQIFEITKSFPIVVLIYLGYIGLVGVLKRFFGSHVYEWVRIKYVPEKASLEVAEKHLREGKTRLEKGLFEGASQEFHAAALVFLRLEDWPKAAENYQMAAQTLSNESNPDFGFGIAWFYALSASSHLLSGNTEKAKEALELGKETLRTRRIDKKAEEKVSLILEFLTAISSNKVQQASEIWQNLERRAGKWGYPVVEETMLLLKKNRALLDDVKPQKT